MKRTVGNWVALFAFTAVAVYLTWLIIQPFVDVIIWAAVLAVVAYPVFERWRQRGWGKGLSSLFTTVFVVLVIVVPLALVGTMLVRQMPTAIESLREGAANVLNPESRTFKYVDRYVDLDQFRTREWWNLRGREIGGKLASQTAGIVGGIFGAILQMFFVLFTLYYLLKDSDRIVPAIREGLPLEPEQANAVFRRSREVISASLNGVLVISAIQGVMGGLAFWVLGLPSPVLWGVVMFLFSMIPMAGAAIVWLPAALYLGAQGHWTKALILIVWGGGAIGMVDNLLRPRLVGERTRLHELIVFFSVLGGLQVFGVLGLVVGPVVVAVTMSLVEVFRQVGRPGASGGADVSSMPSATVSSTPPAEVVTVTVPSSIPTTPPQNF